MSLCDFITFSQRVLTSTNQKNDLIQTMTAYTKHDTNEHNDTNAQSISPTDSERTAILIYIWGEIFLAYNARIGGRFQTGDNACVYLWQNFRSA